jgi:hypothetical protein
MNKERKGRVKKSRVLLYAFLSVLLFGFGCSGPESDQPLLTAEVPLHLEDHLEKAAVTGSDVPDDVPQPEIWSFDVEQPDWKVLSLGDWPFEPAKLSRTDDALRVTLGKYKKEGEKKERKVALGAFYVDVPDWTRDDWASVEVRARTADTMSIYGYDRDADVLRGNLEVVDGRWGASLEINPEPPDEDEKEDEEAAKWRRPVPLLLYDLWNDYYCLNSIHDERPELVEKYKTFLEERWKIHLALSQRFSRPEDSPMTPEQLETLRALGYIR